MILYLCAFLGWNWIRPAEVSFCTLRSVLGSFLVGESLTTMKDEKAEKGGFFYYFAIYSYDKWLGRSYYETVSIEFILLHGQIVENLTQLIVVKL